MARYRVSAKTESGRPGKRTWFVIDNATIGAPTYLPTADDRVEAEEVTDARYGISFPANDVLGVPASVQPKLHGQDDRSKSCRQIEH